ncbi:hypothetical protein GCM10010094_40810 [Streptomyces flaveus]|uniref:Uncharacterized protein n=1 Tax=Streptomyces flaveus TaxID=66370 RepID=A0A917QXP4_9ACTN|nr:hypothetical protein GCM10010094_40810 [Streptomyces flaveus]
MRGQAAGITVAGQIADDGDELGAQNGAHAEHRLDVLGSVIRAEDVADLSVVVLDPFIQRQEQVGRVEYRLLGPGLPRHN